LFSLNVALVFILGRALFASAWKGLALALSVLFFEIACMRTFFQSLQASADPFFAELVCLGVLMALVGWLRTWPIASICACAILGISAFTKPVGMSFLPVWTLFALCQWWPKAGKSAQRLTVMFLSVTLLWGPVELWSLRNYYVFGIAKTVGSGGCSLLAATLPLISDNDRILDDPAKNAAFIAAVRECEKTHQMSWGREPSPWARQCWYEEYFNLRDELSMPFEFLSRLTKRPSEKRQFSAKRDSIEMFQIDAMATQIAWAIIKAHPAAYLGRVVREYISMFSPLSVPAYVWENYNSDPLVVYRTHGPDGLAADFSLYPRTGVPNSTLSNKSVARILGYFVDSPIIKGLLAWYYANQLWLSHFIGLLALIGYVLARAKQPHSVKCDAICRIAVTVMMLFLTTASNYLAVSLCQVARLRYAISGGDIELHLMFLIALLAVFHVLFTLARRFIPLPFDPLCGRRVGG
jgi:hypothetical protein